MTLLPIGTDLNILRLRIGRQLRKWMITLNREGTVDEKLLLTVVLQLNQVSHLIEEQEERVGLSELNHAAADIAIQRSSFFPASDFLRKGIKLLGEHAWIDHYPSMLTMSDALMRMDYCCERLPVSLEVANEILEHARFFDDKKWLII